MKPIKLALIAAGIVLSASAYSQENPTKQDSSATTMPATEQPVTTTTPATAEPLVKPNFGNHFIAVLGNYTSSPETAKSEKNVTVTGDEQNPGKIWIEGLTDVKVYALRKQVPGNYKIPAQKAGDKSIPEGTVIYDDNSKEINICLGCKYKDENPGEAFTTTPEEEKATAKTKKKSTPAATKVISFTGSKTDAGTASK